MRASWLKPLQDSQLLFWIPWAPAPAPVFIFRQSNCLMSNLLKGNVDRRKKVFDNSSATYGQKWTMEEAFLIVVEDLWKFHKAAKGDPCWHLICFFQFLPLRLFSFLSVSVPWSKSFRKRLHIFLQPYLHSPGPKLAVFAKHYNTITWLS